MTHTNINVRLKGTLESHLQQQTGESGLYENASEYIRTLIRNDIDNLNETSLWFEKNILPGLNADRNEFHEVSAQDVINRNQRK